MNSRKYVKVKQRGSQYLVSQMIMYFYKFVYAKRGLITGGSSCFSGFSRYVLSKICACLKKYSLCCKGMWKWVHVRYNGITPFSRGTFLQKHYCQFWFSVFAAAIFLLTRNHIPLPFQRVHKITLPHNPATL